MKYIAVFAVISVFAAVLFARKRKEIAGFRSLLNDLYREIDSLADDGRYHTLTEIREM